MKALYALIGLSKQAHLKYQKRRQKLEDQWLLLFPVLEDWRKRHPSMSLKILYKLIQPEFIGRDKFIAFGTAYGFEAIITVRRCKTTIYTGKSKIPNLLIDAVVYDINLVWTSDITYIKINGIHYYIVFIMDVYSRRIIGYSVSKNLFAQANVDALNMALKTRGIYQFEEKLIHHSDRGSQYNSHLYKTALAKAGIQISMCNSVYENSHIERVHQTIKNQYLRHRNIQSFGDLKSWVKHDVWLYNNEKPHQALKDISPVEFERYICNVPLCQRTPLRLFCKSSSKTKKAEQTLNPQQLSLPFK